VTNDSDRCVEDLLRLATEGDSGACEALYRRYRPLIIAVTSSRIPRELQCRFDVDDIVQSTFANVFRALPSYRYEGERELRAWVAQFAVRSIVDSVRVHSAQLRSAQAESNGFDFEREHDIGSDSDTPSVILSRLERRRELQSALSELPEPHRTIVTLRGVEALEWSAVATAVAMSEDRVRRRYAEAMRQLSQRLA